jgi:oligopeptide/dipeptide ABC transporter ATP-binding protein
MTESILEVRNLVKHFPIRSGMGSFRKRQGAVVRAVDGVSFGIQMNETLGLVGESGSGKTTIGRMIMMLQPPTSGEILFKGKDISKLDGEKLRQIRRLIQMVFQDPLGALDPRQRLENILAEPLNAFHQERGATREHIERILVAVGLSEESLTRYPHQFSGGQRQRICIARALILDPEFVVLDEPTSALDSSIQTQILNLLRQIQEDRKLSYLFISHNVNVVKYMSDRVGVIYCGKIVEIGNTKDVMEGPLHPYTIALIASVPLPDPKSKLVVKKMAGELSTLLQVSTGCRFHTRCQYAQEICKTSEPELREIEKSHFAACHFAENLV